MCSISKEMNKNSKKTRYSTVSNEDILKG